MSQSETYKREISRFYDADGGVGQMPEADWNNNAHLGHTRRTGGNQILQTSLDLIFRYKMKCLDEQSLYRAQKFFKGCQNVNPKGVFDKNPPLPNGERRLDVVAHDDYIALAAVSSIVGVLPHHFDIVEHGKKSGWVFNNSGDVAFTENHKKLFFGTWFITFYKLVGDSKDVGWFEGFKFRKYIGEAESDDDSGMQLRWLMCQAIRRYPIVSPTIRGVAEGFMRSLNLLGGIKKVFERYYGIWHPFAKHGDFV